MLALREFFSRCTIGIMKILATAALFAAALFAAAPEEFSTSAGTIQIIPIQHASLLVKAGGKVLYVDPAQGSYDGLPQADYILITDIHGDHMAPNVVDKVKKASTVIVAPKAVAEKFPGALVMANGDTKTVGEFKQCAPYELRVMTSSPWRDKTSSRIGMPSAPL